MSKEERMHPSPGPPSARTPFIHCQAEMRVEGGGGCISITLIELPLINQLICRDPIPAAEPPIHSPTQHPPSHHTSLLPWLCANEVTQLQCHGNISETLSVGAHHTCWGPWSPSMFASVCVWILPCCATTQPFYQNKHIQNDKGGGETMMSQQWVGFVKKKKGVKTLSKHLRQMAISKQASSIFVDTIPFLNYSYLGYLQL